MPERDKKAPNKIKRKIKSTDAPIAVEYKPSVFKYS
jgi:hypothetical protein